MEQWTGERAAVLSKVLWVGGWAKALATVDFDSLKSSAKPVPNFDWCCRDQFVGTGGLVLSIALYICLSGFVVWFVVPDQWFVLKDQMRALRSRKRRWFLFVICFWCGRGPDVLIGHYVASNPRYSSSTPQALWLVDDSEKLNIFVLHVEVLGSESGLFF